MLDEAIPRRSADLPPAKSFAPQPQNDALEYTAVTALRFATSDGKSIDTQVTFTLLGEVPYTLSPYDTAPHGIEIYEAVLAGKYGPIADYIPPSREEMEARLRDWRDAEIASSQWLIERHRDQLEADSPTTLTKVRYLALQAYREQLRNWPAVEGFAASTGRPKTPAWLAAIQLKTRR